MVGHQKKWRKNNLFLKELLHQKNENSADVIIATYSNKKPYYLFNERKKERKKELLY